MCSPYLLLPYLSLIALLIYVVSVCVVTNPEVTVLPYLINNLLNVSLKSLHDTNTGFFRVIDRSNISTLHQPSSSICGSTTRLVLVVPSALNQREKREHLRAEVREQKYVSVIFVLGEGDSKKIQKEIDIEHNINDDILQVTDPEHYLRLTYKVLTGFLWMRTYCSHVMFVCKTDDNVSIDYQKLLYYLETNYGTETSFITCVSPMLGGSINTQTRPGSLMGKWSSGQESLDRDVMPDYCLGWLYVTSPQVGLALAEVAATYHSILPSPDLPEDLFVTGILRERIANLSVTRLAAKPGESESFWSQLPFYSGLKNIFFNDVLLAKGDSKYPYVNGKRFALCVTLEPAILSVLDTYLPSMSFVLEPLWKFCARD